MKTTQLTGLAAALAGCCLVPTSALADAGGNSTTATTPTTPMGTLTAYPTVVQTGTKPTLSWSIDYPSTVSDVAVINPPAAQLFFCKSFQDGFGG